MKEDTIMFRSSYDYIEAMGKAKQTLKIKVFNDGTKSNNKILNNTALLWFSRDVR